jgi:hypothetical protein
LVLILGLTVAVGQEPPRKEEKPHQKAPPKTPTDELEAAIAASANHPDVRLAQAKLQMAQAELDQAKLLATQRLTATYAKVQAAKAQVEFEMRNYQRTRQLINTAGEGRVAQAELHAAERALAQAKAALAAAEAEWQAARGQPPGHAASPKDADASMTAVALAGLLAGRSQADLHRSALGSYLELANRAVAPPSGSAADRLRELVGKRVRLDLKEAVPFDQALAEFVKQAGLSDLIIRSPEWVKPGYLSRPLNVGPLVGEQTVAGWFQLILDDFNRTLTLAGVPPEYQGKHEVYVRDYGLLITKADLAPPGAPTLAEFARQVQAQKDAAPKPEPKK